MWKLPEITEKRQNYGEIAVLSVLPNCAEIADLLPAAILGNYTV